MNGHTEAGGEAVQQAPSRDEPPLLAHLDRLIAELHTQAPKALNDWDEEGIHRARVATRRLSAALDLVEPVVGKKRRKALARVLRKLRRRLGPLRDADVMLGHLQELTGSGAKAAPAIEWLAGTIGAAREASRQGSARHGSAGQVLDDLGAWHPVREQIVDAADGLPALLAESLHLQLDAFVEQAGRVTKGGAGSEHHDPHELRIAGKALRYTLEMAVAQGQKLPASVMKTFKRMQEQLGAWHDFVVLTDTAMRASLDGLLSHRDPAMQEGVLDLARLTLRRSSKHLAGFDTVWNAKGEALAGTIRAAFPLTEAGSEQEQELEQEKKAEQRGKPESKSESEPESESEAVNESQTDPGPSDSAGPEVPAVFPPDESSAAS
jgi:CHAD domain-containing protein